MEKDTYTNKFRNKKSNFYKFINDNAKSNFTMTLHSKLILNLLHSMLSRTLDVMFKVKQLFTKNYLLFLRIVLYLFLQLCGYLLSKFKGLKK